MSRSDDHDDAWTFDGAEDIALFVESANGRKARKFLGSYSDAHFVMDWISEHGWTGEILDAPTTLSTDEKTVRFVNPTTGLTTDLDPDNYLVFDGDVFFVEAASEYEPDLWDGTAQRH